MLNAWQWVAEASMHGGSFPTTIALRGADPSLFDPLSRRPGAVLYDFVFILSECWT
jgi:hypothetical protein